MNRGLDGGLDDDTLEIGQWSPLVSTVDADISWNSCLVLRSVVDTDGHISNLARSADGRGKHLLAGSQPEDQENNISVLVLFPFPLPHRCSVPAIFEYSKYAVP